MIKISKKKYNELSRDYKGVWEESMVNYADLDKSFIGKRTMLTKDGLLTEGMHFIIVE